MSRSLAVIFLLVLGFACRKTTDTPTDPSGTQVEWSWRYDTVGTVPVLVFGDKRGGWLTAFESALDDGTTVNVVDQAERLPALFLDEEGNNWDIQGKAVAGPRTGAALTPVRTSGGYWFALSGMLEDLALDEGPAPPPYPDFSLEPGWLIPPALVYRGANEDAIPALDFPLYTVYDPRLDSGDDFFLRPEDKVIGVWYADTLRLYPHKILNYHEIVNEPGFSVVYGPLSGTTQVWETSNTITSTGVGFGVSGLTHAGVVLAFDRATGSRWSQFNGLCINGPRLRETVPSLFHLEASWNWWQQYYPDALLLSTETGYVNDYTVDKFATYAVDDADFPFPRDVIDTRLPPKTYVQVVFTDDGRKAYRIESF